MRRRTTVAGDRTRGRGVIGRPGGDRETVGTLWRFGAAERSSVSGRRPDRLRWTASVLAALIGGTLVASLRAASPPSISAAGSALVLLVATLAAAAVLAM